MTFVPRRATPDDAIRGFARDKHGRFRAIKINGEIHDSEAWSFGKSHALTDVTFEEHPCPTS